MINGRRASRQASGNIVQEKSHVFAVSIIQTTRRLQLEQREWVLSKQLLRAGTSIGANVEEAIAAQSKKDFLSKMSIALKEARETHYWLRLIRDSGLLNGANSEAHLSACHERLRLLNSITLTTRHNLSSTARGGRAHSTFIIPHSTLES